MPSQDAHFSQWFAAELKPHEPLLRARLASHFSKAGDIDDIVQEALMKVLQAHAVTNLRCPKAYLFVVARNIALMQMRHRKVEKTDSLTEIDFSSIPDESVDIPQAVARAQEIHMLSQAIQSLPSRCRQIVMCRKLHGMSQKETAAELGLAEHTVEVQTAIGLRKISRYFQVQDRPSQPTRPLSQP